MIVAQAKADGNITVKNSPGRNLHRLLNTIKFISAIFKGLRVGKTLRDAVSDVRLFCSCLRCRRYSLSHSRRRCSDRVCVCSCSCVCSCVCQTVAARTLKHAPLTPLTPHNQPRTPQAYDITLGLLHSWIVRTGIKAGMLGLPSREQFIASIGETEDSAKGQGEEFIQAADTLCFAIERLYVGVDMPASDFKMF